jgi:hypothetical protein
MLTPIWTLLGKPLAALGGRSFHETRERTAVECEKSISVGLLCLVSVATIFAGHALFWRSFEHTAAFAPQIAAGVALVFALLYRIALRTMETMGSGSKALVLGSLGTVMLVNAALAGHELVLYAFKPQVEEQAKLGAAQRLTTYSSTLEASLGLPILRASAGDLDKAFAHAAAERERVPGEVQQLREQMRSCEAIARRLRANIPYDPQAPDWAAAHEGWRAQRSRCNALEQRANQELARHRDRWNQELASVDGARATARKSLQHAVTSHSETIQRDKPLLIASATSGFARHSALWQAVASRRIPLWAAAGLMFIVLLVDAFSFIVKLLARDDAATTDRIQAAGTDLVYNRLHAGMLREQHSQVAEALHAMRGQTRADLAHLSRELVAPVVLQNLEERAFTRASAAHERAQRAAGAPWPSMVARIARMARSISQRDQEPSPTARVA